MAATVKVQRVVNPARRRSTKRRKLTAKQIAAGFGGKRKKAASTHRKRSTKKRKSSASRGKRNPALVVTLGPANPKRRKGKTTMAAKKRRASGTRSKSTKRRNPSVKSKKRTYRRKRNPSLFGATISGGKLAQAVVGGLVGVTATKVIVPALPGTLSSSPLMLTLSSVGVAFGVGWAAGKIDKNLGSAVLFGGLMQAGSVLLNAFVPGIGGSIALNGLGDFVPGYFSQPENPVSRGMLTAGGGNGVSGVGRGAFKGAFSR